MTKEHLNVFCLGVLTSLLPVLLQQPIPAATYEVGPGKPLASIGAVPWATLQPGDTVLIHGRSSPYKEKWVIGRQGTAAAPITVRGVPGPGGELPVIDGSGAVTAPGLNYWSEVRGVIKIGGSNTPPDTMPKHIVVESLEVQNARVPHTFSDDNGNAQAYSQNASGIYLEKGENITIRNCIFHDNGNGLFVASSDSAPSRNILIQGNYIYRNGNDGSIYEHNSYTAAIGMIFERNRYGPLLPGAGGNNLKDRSAGLVVRYNWIEGGNRQLDLVDGEDSTLIRTDPLYRETHVYGNILIEPAAAGNRQILHYGGDSGNASAYRKGTLFVYNNTVVSTRTDRTTLFRLSTNDERADARNNIFYATAGGDTVSFLDSAGVLDLSHNWIKPGWKISFGDFQGTVNNNGTMVQGNSPGFVDETGQGYHLISQSAAVNAGDVLNPGVLPAHNVARQYVKHLASEPRPSDQMLDIGAFEFASFVNQPPAAVAFATPVSGMAPLAVVFDGFASEDSDGTITSYEWDFGDGAMANGPTTSHTYTAAGTFTASLTVTDDDDANSTATVEISVEPEDINEPPVAVLSAAPTSGKAPLTVRFNGVGSNDSDGTIVSYRWNFGDGATALSPAPSHTYTAAGAFTATLTVIDDDGESSSDVVVIEVASDDLAAPVLSGHSSGRAVTLSWTHSSANADGFYLERGEKRRRRINWTRIKALGANEGSFTEAVQRGTHHYRLQAFRQTPQGEEGSSYSNEISFRVK